MNKTRTKEDRSEAEQAVYDLEWTISTMESGVGDFVIQADTPYCGEPEFSDLERLGLELAAISSHGPNGFLRLHIFE